MPQWFPNSARRLPTCRVPGVPDSKGSAGVLRSNGGDNTARFWDQPPLSIDTDHFPRVVLSALSALSARPPSIRLLSTPRIHPRTSWHHMSNLNFTNMSKQQSSICPTYVHTFLCSPPTVSLASLHAECSLHFGHLDAESRRHMADRIVWIYTKHLHFTATVVKPLGMGLSQPT